MGESTSPAAPSRPSEPWAAFQAALGQLVTDTVRREIAAGASSGARGAAGAGSADLKRTVAEAVGAVLLETSLVERVVEKQLKAQAAANPPAAGGSPLAGEDARQEVGKAVREYLSRHLGMLFQTEIRGVIQKELKSFIHSEELKELIDEKFRAISTYLKSEVIPKVVQQEIAKAEA